MSSNRKLVESPKTAAERRARVAKILEGGVRRDRNVECIEDFEDLIEPLRGGTQLSDCLPESVSEWQRRESES